MTKRTTQSSIINCKGLHAQRASHSLSSHTLDSGAFENALVAASALCHRRGLPLSIVMLALHRTSAGSETSKTSLRDDTMRSFASILIAVCGDRDLVSRRSGDRFVVALPGSDAGDARKLVDRCRRAMTTDPVLVGSGALGITVSAGIAGSTRGFVETQQQLIQRAEAAAEQARMYGGNQIVVWHDPCRAEAIPSASRRLTRDGVSRWVNHLREQIRSTCTESTRALVAAVEAKDHYTEAHSLTVAAYAEAIGKRMGMPGYGVATLRDAALLHDIGKIGIPDAILTKAGPLTAGEFAVIRTHPAVALDILRHISHLADQRPFILHHHERYDGRGYPNGLAGARIPIGARILTVTDALDTMLSPRTYKKAYSLEKAKSELIRHAGKQFDPNIVATTLRWLDDSPGELAHAEDRKRETVSIHLPV